MRTWVLAALVLLVTAGGAVAADTWASNTGIVSGLPDVGYNSAPTTFQKDGTWYLIAGEGSGAFNGYNWTGSAWQGDSAIASGLGSALGYDAPAVFQMDSIWYLISGTAHECVGYNWTGSTWQSDSSIASGLGYYSYAYPDANVYQMGNIWYLIETSGTTNYGYNWTGSTWQSDSSIIVGLGSRSPDTIFQVDGVPYLIDGYMASEAAGAYEGYNWTGSTWQSDTTIISGLSVSGNTQPYPCVFCLSYTWYLISGASDGTFKGYTGEFPSVTPTNLAYVTGKFWVNHTWTAGSGSYETDSYNVSINGTWHNNTINTHYNNTLTTYGDWSNVTVYAYNTTYGLSDYSVSEDVQLPYPTPSTPSGAGSTWDYYWVNHTWTEGSSYGVWCGDTDSYNVSINGTWHNDTTNTYYNNTGLSPHGWSNASIYAFNNTGGINETYIYQNVRMANRAITITNTSDWSGGVSENVYVDYDATDADSDTPTFSCNRTDLFADFDTATGQGNWTAATGTYYVDFGVSDGWGSTDNYTMTITGWGGAVYLISGDNNGFQGYNWIVSTWQSDSGIVSGLGAVDERSAPTVFQKDSIWYLISGYYGGGFSGHNWAGSAWQSDSGIVSGLSDVGDYSTLDVFQKDSVWYLIAGEADGVFNGYNWTGSTWQSDSAIVSGLGYVAPWSTPTVFQKDSIWYLISGDVDGCFSGYNWTGSTWQSDSAIVSGLGDVGGKSAPTVFLDGVTWYLISGNAGGGFNGYNWTGSTWQSDSGIVSGLGSLEGYSRPVVFISYTAPTPTNLTNTTGEFWVNHTWEAGDGVFTDSYNVSINDVWYNSTTTPYYNDTDPVDWGQWSNITVYAYNTSVGISMRYLSDDVQILPTLTPYNDFTSDGQLVLSPSDRQFTIEFKCTSDMNIKTWTWSGVDTSSGTSNSIETTATKYLNSWKGEVSVTASNDYGAMEAITWSFDITPPSYWFDPYYGQRDPILVISYCDDTAGTPYFYYVEMEVDTTNCVYSDCRDLFFYDPRYGVTLPFYTSREDGVVQKTTDETIYVRMQLLTLGEQTIYMYSQCDESGVLRTNQFGGYAIIPNVGGVEKEFYCIPPCDDSEDVYTAGSGSCIMNVQVNESGSCDTKYLGGDVGSGVTWSCPDICGVGDMHIYTAGTGTVCVAYDQDRLLIQPWGAGVGLYIKSSKALWAAGDSCWVSIGGHNTNIPDGTVSDSFSIGGGLTGITTRLSVYRSWQSGSSASASIYEIYYIVSQDPNPCGVETIFRYHDYMIVVLYDDSGNLIPGANVAVYDTTANTYLQKWEGVDDGIITFQVEDYSGHTMQIAVKTFDGVFIHDVYIDPDGGLTNITIPLRYNLNIHPQDQFGTPLTDVFAGLSEYTPLNPLSFWGMSMYGQQYVPVTNCSGFAMCDIYAEKGGYADYNVTALNWTSRSAMVKDYRHDVVLEKE